MYFAAIFLGAQCHSICKTGFGVHLVGRSIRHHNKKERAKVKSSPVQSPILSWKKSGDDSKKNPTYPWSIPEASPKPKMKGIPS